MTDREKLRDALLVWVNQFDKTDPANDFHSLCDGVKFIQILCGVSSLYFDPQLLRHVPDVNPILCQSNIERLIQALNTFVQEVQGHPTFNLGDTIQAKSVIEPDSDALISLAEFVFTICVTSGSGEIMSRVRSLSKSEQQDLQTAARRVMATFNIKKASVPSHRGGAAHVDPAHPATPASTTNTSPTSVRVFGSNSDPAFLFEENKKLTDQIQSLQRQVNVNSSVHEELVQRNQQLEVKYKKLVEEQSGGQNALVRDLYDKLEAKGRELREASESLKALQLSSEGLAREVDQLREGRDQLLREQQQLQEQLDDEGKKRQEIRSELDIEKDKAEALRQRLSAAEISNRQLAAEKRTLEEKLAARKLELDAKDADLLAAQTEITTMKVQLDEQAEQIATLEAASSMATTLTRRSDHIASPMEALAQEIVQLRQERDAVKRDLDAREATVSDLLNKTSASSETQTQQLAALKAENESLKQHLQSAIAAADSLKSKLDTSRADAAAATAASVVNAVAGGGTKLMRELEQENAQLKERLNAGRAAAQVEQAAIFSTFFECGHRALRIQQRQILAAPPVPTGALYDPPNDNNGLPVSFLERHRRAMEHTMLLNLVQPPIASPGGRRSS